MEKLKMHSPNFAEENIAKLADLFPGCVTEKEETAKDANGREKVVLKKAIDWDLLKQELSQHIVEGPQERYHLNWPGKREALLTANAPIAKTLRPCRKESVDFDTTENLFIEGDNLDALKLLQETYLGKVKMIYIDPPYNTGNDFIYKDDFRRMKDEYLEASGQVDEDGGRLVANTEANGRFHSDWLSMMYSRLKLARNLLKDDGVIFISIDDGEVDNLKKICSEIFGVENFVGCAGRITKKSNNKGDYWAPNFDYLLTFTKNILVAEPFFGGVNVDAYNHVDKEGDRAGEKYQLVRLYMSTIQNRNPEQRFWIECPDGQKVIPPGTTFPPEKPNLGDGIWRWTRKKLEAEKERIVIKAVSSSNLVTEDGSPARWNIFTKTYLQDVIDNSSAKPNSFIEGHINQKGSHELRALDIPFDYSKPSTLISYLMEVSKVKSDDIILDFFAGSATTAHAVMQLNAEDNGKRKFIMVQLPEPCDEKSEAYKAGYKTIAEISKERIRRAGEKIKEELTAKHAQDTNRETHERREKEDDLFAEGDKENFRDFSAFRGSKDLDTGFRVLKVDSSNMADVYYTPDAVEQNLLSLLTNNIKDDRSSEDLLFQVLLDWGVDLTLPISREVLTAKGRENNFEVFFVDNNALAACFVKDGEITEDFCKALAGRQPLRVVFRDAGFKDDSVKINVEQIFKLMSPHTEVKTI